MLIYFKNLYFFTGVMCSCISFIFASQCRYLRICSTKKGGEEPEKQPCSYQSEKCRPGSSFFSAVNSLFFLNNLLFA